MGLAASQARFLGITARKANCEFKSTQLAQERLELSDQLTTISQQYANALNSTRLVWSNDACSEDFGVSYSLLMMPSAANDFNPYFVTTKSGAILLNSKYASAAKAAGIGVSGGTATEDGRDKFLAALVGQSLITEETADAISVKNYEYDPELDTFTVKTDPTDKIYEADYQSVAYNDKAGLGDKPLDTSVYTQLTLADLVLDENIGKLQIDWLQIFSSLANTKEGSASNTEYITEYEYNNKYNQYKNKTNDALSSYLDEYNSTNLKYIDGENNIYYCEMREKQSATNLNNLSLNLKAQISNAYKSAGTELNDPLLKKMYEVYNEINNPNITAIQKQKYEQEYNELKSGVYTYFENDIEKDYKKVLNGYTNNDLIFYDHTPNESEFKELDSIYQKRCALYAALLEEEMYRLESENNQFRWTKDGETTDLTNENGSRILKFDDVFNLNDEIRQDAVNGIEYYNSEGEEKTKNLYGLTVIRNGSIQSSQEQISSLRIADLLKSNVVIYACQNNENGKKSSIQNIKNAATSILEFVAKALGYGQIGVGINVDDSTNDALNKALIMTEKIYLNANNAVSVNNYKQNKSKDLYQDSAYANAVNYNRIGSNTDKDRAAVSLTNMISAFLTYYDNILRGSDSNYTVGRANDKSDSSKTYFVTDDMNYIYAGVADESVEYNQKMANFYDELYNNICAYGYRVDDMVEDSDYLQSAIKDGRYSLMSLNQDGYYYQTRYNDTGYLVEQKDQDAITKAEADYTQKKAQITYKEDVIDSKTKTLDAEIAALTQEMNSVQGMISKSIEKIFSMFQGN